METAASVSNRCRIRCERLAQQIILDHIKILRDDKKSFSIEGVEGDKQTPLKLSKIPSIQCYLDLKHLLILLKGNLSPHIDEYTFQFTPEGTLIFHSSILNSKTKFKSRKNFDKYLKKLKLLRNPPIFKEVKPLAENEESQIGIYEDIKRKQEGIKIFRMEDGTKVVLRGSESVKSKRILGNGKIIARKLGFKNYENYKKFKQRAKKDNLI